MNQPYVNFQEQRITSLIQKLQELHHKALEIKESFDTLEHEIHMLIMTQEFTDENLLKEFNETKEPEAYHKIKEPKNPFLKPTVVTEPPYFHEKSNFHEKNNTQKQQKGKKERCDYCGRHFVKKSYQQRFCSLSCKDNYHNFHQSVIRNNKVKGTDNANQYLRRCEIRDRWKK